MAGVLCTSEGERAGRKGDLLKELFYDLRSRGELVPRKQHTLMP